MKKKLIVILAMFVLVTQIAASCPAFGGLKVKLEVVRSDGSVAAAAVVCTDPEAKIDCMEIDAVPWTKEFTLAKNHDLKSVTVAARSTGKASMICRIYINGDLVKENENVNATCVYFFPESHRK